MIEVAAHRNKSTPWKISRKLIEIAHAYRAHALGKAQAIKSEIDKTDNEIDQMVYELYGLNEDEIVIVERAGK